MTIDEFKKNIAPFMCKGYVGMDKDETWCFYIKKPFICEKSCVWLPDVEDDYVILTTLFNIEPVENWTKSLIETGK